MQTRVESTKVPKGLCTKVNSSFPSPPFPRPQCLGLQVHGLNPLSLGPSTLPTVPTASFISFTWIPAETMGMMEIRWTMGNDVPGKVRIQRIPVPWQGIRARFNFLAWAQLPIPLQAIPLHLTLAHWPNTSQVSAGLPVLFCHDCCEQGRSGWVHLAYHGPLQGARGGNLRKAARKVSHSGGRGGTLSEC